MRIRSFPYSLNFVNTNCMGCNWLIRDRELCYAGQVGYNTVVVCQDLDLAVIGNSLYRQRGKKENPQQSRAM